MDADRVIKHVNERYRFYWRSSCGLNCDTFGRLLAPHLPNLTPTQYSRLTNRRKTPSKILAVLQIPEVLKRIERALQCNGLFAAGSEEAVNRLLDEKAFGHLRKTHAASPSDCLLIPNPLLDDRPALSAREERAARQLATSILVDKFHVLCCTNLPLVGTSFIAHAVASVHLPREGITETFLIQPYSAVSENFLNEPDIAAVAPFDQAILELGKHLGLPSPPSASQLFDAIVAKRSVLFVLQAGCVPERSSDLGTSIARLLREARKRPPPSAGIPIPIVLIGQPQGDVPSQRVKYLGDIANGLAFGSKESERNDFFQSQLRRFCSLRGNLVDEAGSGRLKRAREYYTADTASTIWPSTLRMLAFFASNHETFSCFDPTAGWKRLAGLELSELPIDIRLHLAEVIHQARSVSEDGKRQSALRALRWASTAVYWLTDEAAEDLGRGAPRMALESFHAAIDRLPGLVEIERDARRAPRYKMDMALRAVVQERWGHKDPLGRAHAHYKIALRLYTLRDDKQQLHAEYPVQPHWGRSRMHFLAECIRHLMRACDHSLPPKNAAHGALGFEEPFPSPPKREWRGCDPTQVVNYCFAELFQQQLNGNERSGTILNRKLALQHGAYNLTGELLELMSEDNRLGSPHPALNPAYVHRYLREVAYARLDLGDLVSARKHFEHLVAHARSASADPTEVVQYQLDLIVVLGAMDDLVAARELLAGTRQQVTRGADPFEGNARGKRARQSLATRLDAREAHLLYLEGDLQRALEFCERIESESPSAMVRDTAHLYIAILGALGGEARLRRAMEVCVRNLFENTSKGLHHEALGFRVALGHALRKLGMLDVAEVTLDQVYRDVLKYGCSERTYLAMLVEAGRIVLDQGRPERAYAAYLRPCFDRARARGYRRIAEAARRYAIDCLEPLRAAVLRMNSDQRRFELETQLQGRGNDLRPEPIGSIDPQYAYDIASVEQWVPRLTTAASLDTELATLSDALDSSLRIPTDS